MSTGSRRSDGPLTENRILILQGAQTVVFTALGFAMWWFSGRPMAAFITFAPHEFVYGILIAAGFTALAAALLYGFPRVCDHLVRAQSSNLAPFGSVLTMRGVVFISFCAGLWEEAFFRAGLQTLLGDYVGAPLAILVTSAAFAILHFSTPLIGGLLFVIGCVFGTVFWQTGSLLAVAIGHFLYDIFALWFVLRRMRQLGLFDGTDSLPAR